VIEEAARQALSRSSFSIALSGGRSPWRMLAELDPAALGEPGTTIFQVDERVAPEGDPARNLTHLRQALPEPALQRLLPLPVNDDDLEAAAARYGAALPEAIDLVHLGLGPDGHTASLVPGDAVLEVADRPVAVTSGEYQGHRRMTLTYPTLKAARRILFLVTGAEKRDALAKLRAGDPSIPAGRVEVTDGLIVADKAALGYD
jgi:6-phosphogluconolactonase/glucosamine-6-phosphate isomerase/deaminase